MAPRNGSSQWLRFGRAARVVPTDDSVQNMSPLAQALRKMDPSASSLARIIHAAVLVKVEPKTDSNLSSEESAAESCVEYRLGTEKDADAELRRARIYAINKLLRSRQEREFDVYKAKKKSQMMALERCAASGAVTLAHRGLHRLAERCERKRRDDERRSVLQRRLAEENRRKEAEALARIAALERRCARDAAMLKANEEILNSMPLYADAKAKPPWPYSAAGNRYCPWFSTVDGCLLGRCPLSHVELPKELVTWKYRLWALEAHNGWRGEPVNQSLLCSTNGAPERGKAGSQESQG